MESVISGGYTVDSGEKFWITRSSKDEKDLPSVSSSNSSSILASRMISCTEDGCIKEFMSYREYDKHQLIGDHIIKLERKTLHDYCSKTIASSLDTHFSIATAKLKIAIESSVHNGLTDLDEGWALRTVMPRNKDDQPTRALIRSYFLEKRKEGKKCHPNEIEMYIKALKKPGSSVLQVSPRNRLNLTQIKSLINLELKKERGGEIRKANENVMSKNVAEDEDEDDEDYGEETDDETELGEMVIKSHIFKSGEGSDESDDEPLRKHRKKAN